MKAMVLAAGEGRRLRPLTLEAPKVLLPLAGKPLIEYTLSWLQGHGIREVAINVCHLGDRVMQHLGDGSQYGLNIVYSEEESLLGTAGGVKRIGHFFDDTFVVAYGDNLTDFDLTDMLKFHQERGALATVALFGLPKQEAEHWEVGVVRVGREGRITHFVEKPPGGARPGDLSNGGVYVLERQVLDYIPNEKFCDFAYDIFPRLLVLSLPIYGYVIGPQCYLMDIGTMDKYQKAQAIVGQLNLPDILMREEDDAGQER